MFNFSLTTEWKQYTAKKLFLMLVGCELQKGVIMGICCTTPESRLPDIPRNKPLVRMCSSGNHFSNFADIGDKVVLFVDFGQRFKPLPRMNQRDSLHGAIVENVWPDQRQHDPEGEQCEVGTKTSNGHILFSQGGGGTPKNLGGV